MELKIQIPDGYEIDTFDINTGNVKFKKATPKSVIERIKTVEDILSDHKLTKLSFADQCQGLSEDEVAYRILKMLTTTLNEGWTPDWANNNQYKYFPWFEMRGSGGFRFCVYDCWHSASIVGSRLCFKTRELAEYAGKQFVSVYEQYMIIK